MNEFDTFERTLAGCVDAMFGCEDRGEACSRAEPPEPWDIDVMFASIGFACEGARGSLLLVAPTESTRGLLPTTAETSDEVCCDFLGELSNMLAGRLKNQLLKRGVVILPGTPITACARAARVVASTEPMSSVWLQVNLPTGDVYVRLDARFDATFALGAEEIGSAGAEGDMLFF